MSAALGIALADAATNCERDGANCTLTLRSGVQISGKLQKQRGSDLGTVHVKHDDGGWSTVLREEIAAVSTAPNLGF